MAGDGRDDLDQAYDQLEEEVPDRVSRAIHWLRDPGARWIRIPVGVLFILGGLLWFLPVLGIEMLPIGLLLVAQDVPFLRRPVGRAMIWLEGKWVALRRQWMRRRAEAESRAGRPVSRTGAAVIIGLCALAVAAVIYWLVSVLPG